MILLIISIIIVIIGFWLLSQSKRVKQFSKSTYFFDSDMFYAENLKLIATGFLVVGFTALGVELITLGLKPIDYKKFKVEYNVVRETITNSADMRDTNYTQKLIELNTEIMTNREWKDNIWVGIYYNEDIAELELLKKE